MAGAPQNEKLNPNRLYFGNVSFNKSKEDIEQFFSSCGQVDDVYLVKDKMTQRFQGYGFITFADAAGKEAALQLNGTEFEGRPLKINLEARASDKTKLQQRLFIRKIPADKTEDDVKAVFAQYGQVENFFFVKDKMTKQNKDFGFLDFSTSDEAKAALELDGQAVFGEETQPLSVKIAHQKKPVQRGPYGPVGGPGGYNQPYNPYYAGGPYGGGWGGPPQWQGGYGGGYGGGMRGRGRGRGGGRGRGRGRGGGYGGGAPQYGGGNQNNYNPYNSGGQGGGAYGGNQGGGAYGGYGGGNQQQW